MSIDTLKDGVYAQFDTPKGTIIAELEYQKAPLTVTNFVGLAEGTLENDFKKGEPFYDGLKFHRVVPNFVIQAGCPEGDGRGGPGYRFADEIHADLKHTGPGMLSMANAGPNTNGSQFFITHTATPHLDGKHAVFGHVVEGIDVVNAIEQGDTIDKLTIIRKGSDAEGFKANDDTFKSLLEQAASNAENEKKEMREGILGEIRKQMPDSKESDSGIIYMIKEEGSGQKPEKGNTVRVHYTGSLIDGSVFDSSVHRNEPFEFAVGTGKVIPGWDEAVLDMSVGEKRLVVLPPELGYGSVGVRGIIPPDAFLVFDIELLEIV